VLSSFLEKKYRINSAVDKASADPTVLGGSMWFGVGGVGVVVHQTYETLKFIVGAFRLDSVLLTEGTVLDPCYEIGHVRHYQ
jgi:hypothetical protein